MNHMIEENDLPLKITQKYSYGQSPKILRKDKGHSKQKVTSENSDSVVFRLTLWTYTPTLNS